MNFYHLVWCGVCQGITVHDAGICIICLGVVPKKEEVIEEEKEPDETNES